MDVISSPMVPRLLYTPAHVASVTSLSVRSVQAALADGALSGVRFGKVWRITAAAVASYCQLPLDQVVEALEVEVDLTQPHTRRSKSARPAEG